MKDFTHLFSKVFSAGEGVESLSSNEQKQLARERRERKFRRRITALSWTLPVFAFGSFFTIWHNVSAAVNSPTKSKQSVSNITNHKKSNVTPSLSTQSVKTVKPSVLFKIGSTGPQVSVIQEQLYELGYLHHPITEYYGSLTAQAVSSFQMAQHLNVTGEIDNATLTALQQAAKHHQVSNLVSTPKSTVSQHSFTAVSAVSSHQPSSRFTTSAEKSSQTTHETTVPTAGSAAVSHQSMPQSHSSAS